jgi:nicotinamide-nucleotide amidase
MFPPDIHDLADKVVQIYKRQRQKVVTAESCTGGLLAGALTEISGSSAIVERGFVTYSNDAKVEVLGVMPELIAEYGAVSEQVAEAMARGALEFSLADVAVSVTGVAGPLGGSAAKPVGLVYFGLATRAGIMFHYTSQFNGDRDDIRQQAVKEALKLLLSVVEDG